MKNIEKVVARLIKAAQENELLVIFADSDLDGVTSAIMLEQTFKELGGESVVYISDRDRWGHGLTASAVSDISEIEKGKLSLLVTLDCGITNFEGIKSAKEKGYEVIVIDHHKIIDKIPEADIVLDPHQPEDEYPFKKLANAGIVYKLTEILLKEKFNSKKRSFLELLVVAIVADMVPQQEDNAEYMREGLPLLKNPHNTGLAVIKERSGEDFVEKVVSLFNISKITGKHNETYTFLTTTDTSVAQRMVVDFEERQMERKVKLEAAVEDIISSAKEDDNFVLYGGHFDDNLGGKIASRIVQHFKKTAFIYKEEGEYGKGSVRTIKGEDAVAIMSYCRESLESFGGHPEAAGFVVAQSKVEDFRKQLQDYYIKK